MFFAPAILRLPGEICNHRNILLFTNLHKIKAVFTVTLLCSLQCNAQCLLPPLSTDRSLVPLGIDQSLPPEWGWATIDKLSQLANTSTDLYQPIMVGFYFTNHCQLFKKPVNATSLYLGKPSKKKHVESVSMLIPRGWGPRASAHTSLGFFLHAPNLLVWL